MKALPFALLLSQLALWSCGPTLGVELPALDKATGCRFQPPETWKFTVIRWEGQCEDHVAEGSGARVQKFIKMP